MKPMLLLSCAGLLAGALFSGCLNLTPPASPVQSHGLTLAVESSRFVRVNWARFQMNHDELELAGAVSKQPNATTTAFSHLEVSFCDGAGTVLQTKAMAFVPHAVGDSRFSSPVGYFSLPLNALPEGTAGIVVRAIDQSAAGPGD